jgi:hypothetical protein
MGAVLPVREYQPERNGLALSNAGFPAGFRRRRRLFDPPSPGSPWSWNSLKPYRAFGWAFSQDGLHHLYGFPASPGSGPKSLVFRHSVCSRLRQVFRSASAASHGIPRAPRYLRQRNIGAGPLSPTGLSPPMAVLSRDVRLAAGLLYRLSCLQQLAPRSCNPRRATPAGFCTRRV